MLNKHYDVTSNPEEAEILFLNTCAFIEPAKEESINAIFDLIGIKENKKLVVLGCLVKRYKNILKKEIPEIDYLLPPEPDREIEKIFSIKSEKIPPTGRILLTPKSYAFLKISEGCNRKCSFCVIPSIRGRYRSFKIDDLISEVKFLIENYSIKELIIVSQDTSYYGKDLYGKFALPYLLDELQKLPLEWIRLHYLYPSKELTDLVDYIKNSSDKVLPYFDIPFQHFADSVLKAMRRGYNQKFIEKVVNYIKEKIPSSVLRTTVIVGFPTEKEKDFDELLKFTEKGYFDYMGVFPYYHEENTFAWKHYIDEIPWEEKLKRKEILEELQSYITEKNLSRFLNKIEPLLVEGWEEIFINEEEKVYVPYGRVWFQSPEVDGITYLEGIHKNFSIGEFVNVKLKELTHVDFKATVI